LVFSYLDEFYFKKFEIVNHKSSLKQDMPKKSFHNTTSCFFSAMPTILGQINRQDASGEDF